MNTKSKQDQKKNHQQRARNEQGVKKQSRTLHHNLKSQGHEQEHPETRLTR
jgi:hypothetical protein